MSKLPKQYQKHELIAVHLSKADPVPDIIRPEGFYSPNSARSTIHFSLNGMVNDHSGSGVDPYHSRKWAIVVPLIQIADRVEAMASEDTYIIGEIDKSLVEVMKTEEVEDHCRSLGYDWHRINGKGWREWTGPQQEELAQSLGFDDSPHFLHWTYKLEDLFYRQLQRPNASQAQRIKRILDEHGQKLPSYILDKVTPVIN